MGEGERETFKCQNLGGEKRCRKSGEAERVRADVELHGGLVNSVSTFSHGNRDISPRVARKFRVESVSNRRRNFLAQFFRIDGVKKRLHQRFFRNRVSITVGVRNNF